MGWCGSTRLAQLLAVSHRESQVQSDFHRIFWRSAECFRLALQSGLVVWQMASYVEATPDLL